jgi:hypothetical protein
MKDNYDFSKGIKNPYVDKLKQGYTVTVYYDFADDNVRGEVADKDSKAQDKVQKQA